MLAQIANGEILAKVISHVGDKDYSLFVPALRILGNILTTDDTDIIDKALYHGALKQLGMILYSPNSNLIKECCWALSNICAGPP